MKILTPNAKYSFITNDRLINEKDILDSQQVVKEAWVENVYQIHAGDFSENGVFIDLGANIGAVSLQVASFNDTRFVDKIKIFAYEPEPNNMDILTLNVVNNNKIDEVQMIQKAVSNYRGIAQISNRGGNSTIDDSTEGESSDVEVISLEDVFADNAIDECDVMKVDIEGSEYAMLIGTNMDTLRKIKYLTLEFSPIDLETFGKMIAHLAQGFGIQIIGVPERGGYIYARRY